MAENTVLTDFFQSLRKKSHGLLLLDYDGTLAPFRQNRHEAFPAPGIREAVNEILLLENSRIVIVTGRAPHEISALLKPIKPLEVWGCHGREHCAVDGTITIHGVTDDDQAALLQGQRLVAKLDYIDQHRMDVKTGCMAVHWRGLEHRAGEIEQEIRTLWDPLVANSGLQILVFDGGIELCVPGRTKGDAINALITDVDSEAQGIAFLGDDLTDEDGFASLGKRGLSVLVRNEPRETLAPVRLTMPHGVLSFLTLWKDSLAPQTL